MARISSRLRTVDISVDELADRVVRAQSWAAVFEGKRCNSNFVQSELLAVDIDGGLPFDQAIKRCRTLDIIPCICYPTFSNSIDHPKYRIVWRLNQPVTEPDKYRWLSKCLLTVFPEADRGCHDPARMFFGTNQGIWYCDPRAVVTLQQIVDAAGGWLYGHNPKHAKSQMDNLHAHLKDEVGVDGDSCEDTPHSGFCDEASNVYIGSVTKSPIPGTRTRLRDVDFDRIAHHCRLYSSFISGAALEHNLTFGLMTNLLYARGGEKQFRLGLSRREEWSDPAYRGKWLYQLSYSQRRRYSPQRCENFCPYTDSCEHYDNLLMFGKRVRGEVRRVPGHEDNPRIQVEEAERQLRLYYHQARTEEDCCIHLLLGDMGLGKSCCYLNERNALIAVPTHHLAQEVVARMHEAGNTLAFAVPNLSEIDPDLDAEMKVYRKVGDHGRAMKLLFSHLRKAENKVRRHAASKTEEQLVHYKECLDQMRAGGVTCVITHARFLVSEIDISRYDAVVIDEDILSDTIRVGSCKVADVRALHSLAIVDKAGAASDLEIIASRVTKADVGVVQEQDHYVIQNSEQLIGYIATHMDRISSNVPEWLGCDIWAKIVENGEEIIYFCKRPSLPACKLIVMSATASPELYCAAFGDRVKVYRADKVSHRGTIVQVCGSHSRRALMSDRSDSIINYVHSIVGDTPVITYAMLKRNKKLNVVQEVHLGKLEGINSFEGRDLAVLGTPHVNPTAYHMYAAALGFKPRIADTSPRLRTIRHNGYEFDLVSYSDDSALRQIQVWLIESELMQAVGRARTLRNECTVYVFADLPLRQADVVVSSRTDPAIVRQLGQIRGGSVKQAA